MKAKVKCQKAEVKSKRGSGIKGMVLVYGLLAMGYRNMQRQKSKVKRQKFNAAAQSCEIMKDEG
jgi:hypothetical protein